MNADDQAYTGTATRMNQREGEQMAEKIFYFTTDPSTRPTSYVPDVYIFQAGAFSHRTTDGETWVESNAPFDAAFSPGYSDIDEISEAKAREIFPNLTLPEIAPVVPERKEEALSLDEVLAKCRAMLDSAMERRHEAVSRDKAP